MFYTIVKILKKILPSNFTSNISSEEDWQNQLNGQEIITDLVEALLHSPIADLL